MTRYLCVDESHRTDGRIEPVDLTPAVRLERSLTPRSDVYLSFTEDLLRELGALGGPGVDREAQIRRLISNEDDPVDLPVVLLAERSQAKTPGRYELDDLRRTDPIVEQIASGAAARHLVAPDADGIVVLDDGDARTVESGATTLTRQKTRLIPQGIFQLHDLAARMAIAGTEEDALIDAIRYAPRARPDDLPVAEPWRVIVPCPVVGSEAFHETLFSGAGDEPAVVYGTRASGIDLMVETSAPVDLAPAAELARLERRTMGLMAVESSITTLLLVGAWISGALAMALRDAGSWLALSLVLAASAVGIAVVPLFATRDREAEIDDTFAARRSYADRIALLRWASSVSAVMFGLALFAGVVPPMLSDGATSTATISFDTSRAPVAAAVDVSVAGLSSGSRFTVDVREFTGDDPVGTLIAHLPGATNDEGSARIAQTLGLDPRADFLTVAVVRGEGSTVPCTPSLPDAAGCTVTSIPSARPATDPSSGPAPSSSLVTGPTVVVPPATADPVVVVGPQPSP